MVIKDRRLFNILIAVQVILLLASFLFGFFVHEHINKTRGQFPVLTEAFNVLQKHGLKEDFSEKRLEYGMINGLVQAYNDPYTIFVEPPQHELQTNQLEGKFGGIGARLDRIADGAIILYPFPDSPAALAGILDGDQLIQVEDLQIVSETSMDEIQAAIRGPVGKKVNLVILRPSEGIQMEIPVKRQEVHLPSVTWNLTAENPEVGAIQINIIAATTPEETEKAIQDLQSKGATHFILDLRNNYGGLVNAGVDTAKLFLEKGDIMQQKYRDQDITTFSVSKTGIFSDIPMVILVNHGTASAAEIVAGALQGLNRAPLIGAPSFGKDSIQIIFDLQDGSSLHVTSAHWWIPSQSIDLAKGGLIPDISLPDEQANGTEIIAVAIEELLKMP